MFAFYQKLMGEETLRDSIDGFIIDAKNTNKQTAIAFPLLKLSKILLIALVSMKKEDGRILLTILHGTPDDTDENRGIHVDICLPEELSVEREEEPKNYKAEDSGGSSSSQGCGSGGAYGRNTADQSKNTLR